MYKRPKKCRKIGMRAYSYCDFCDKSVRILQFLGPRGPLVLPLIGPVPSRPSALKIWITYIQAYMPYESCKDSSNQPYGPMASLGCPLDPLGPPGNPPIDPLRPINRSLGLIALLRSPQLPHKSHSPSSLSPPTPPSP